MTISPPTPTALTGAGCAFLGSHELDTQQYPILMAEWEENKPRHTWGMGVILSARIHMKLQLNVPMYSGVAKRWKKYHWVLGVFKWCDPLKINTSGNIIGR